MSRTDIFEATVEHFLHPIMKYMNDPAISEIMINCANEIYIETKGKLTRIPETFESEEVLRSAVTNVLQFTGKRVSDDQPLIDSRLPDGSRIHVVLPPLCKQGTCMTIRKFAKIMFDAEHLIKLNTWTQEAMSYVDMCVKAEKNMLVAGGTSSGKTCLLNVISSFIPDDSRIVTIEDSAELELQQNHLITLEARSPDRWGRGEISIRDLFKSSLRLRPDRIVIGEVRSGEALDMIQAMTSGHAGSMSTLHANTALDTLNRLETLALMSKIEIPLHALRSQISSAIDVIVLMTRLSGGQRVITEIAEVLPLDENGHYQVMPMFTYKLSDPNSLIGRLEWTGMRSTFSDEPKMRMLEPHWGLARQFFTEGASQQPA